MIKPHLKFKSLSTPQNCVFNRYLEIGATKKNEQSVQMHSELSEQKVTTVACSELSDASVGTINIQHKNSK